VQEKKERRNEEWRNGRIRKRKGNKIIAKKSKEKSKN
jgi:hypothetical protein